MASPLTLEERSTVQLAIQHLVTALAYPDGGLISYQLATKALLAGSRDPALRAVAEGIRFRVGETAP